jgi:uncharacterized protein YqeY
MSTKIKERLKKLQIELDKAERAILDSALVQFAQTDCDTAIEMMTDDQVLQITNKIIKRRKKKLLLVN